MIGRPSSYPPANVVVCPALACAHDGRCMIGRPSSYPLLDPRRRAGRVGSRPVRRGSLRAASCRGVVLGLGCGTTSGDRGLILFAADLAASDATRPSARGMSLLSQGLFPIARRRAARGAGSASRSVNARRSTVDAPEASSGGRYLPSGKHHVPPRRRSRHDRKTLFLSARHGGRGGSEIDRATGISLLSQGLFRSSVARRCGGDLGWQCKPKSETAAGRYTRAHAPTQRGVRLVVQA